MNGCWSCAATARSTRTLEGYRDSLRLLAEFLTQGGFPLLANVTAEHLREWLNALPERGNKPATVNTRYRAAGGFFKWLVLEGERRDNPLDRIEPPRVPETVQASYTAEDVQRVLKALNGRRLKGVDAARRRRSCWCSSTLVCGPPSSVACAPKT